MPTPYFPFMFIVNINDCITKENVDIRVPRPRSIIEHNSQMNNRFREGEPPYTGTTTFSASASGEQQLMPMLMMIIEYRSQFLRVLSRQASRNLRLAVVRALRVDTSGRFNGLAGLKTENMGFIPFAPTEFVPWHGKQPES
ncbi:unnamed protein product [Penicillium nalgiovense]|nr:unnamed protein product [Penicillium nalgiovense]